MLRVRWGKMGGFKVKAISFSPVSLSSSLFPSPNFLSVVLLLTFSTWNLAAAWDRVTHWEHLPPGWAFCGPLVATGETCHEATHKGMVACVHFLGYLNHRILDQKYFKKVFLATLITDLCFLKSFRFPTFNT